MNTNTMTVRKATKKSNSVAKVGKLNEVQTTNEVETTNEVKAKNDLEKVERINKVLNELGTKKVGDKEIMPTKKLVNALVTIDRLNAKSEKTNFDKLLLLNANIKKDEITNINKLYNRLKNDYEVECIDFLGGSKFPTFAEFKEKLPIKFAFSIWDGLNTIYKFNTNAQRKAKAEKQQAKVNAI